MRFLVDAQLPPALARFIASRGHEAEHVADCGLERASDAAIWDHAVAVGAVIVTKDEDFAQRRIIQGQGPRIAWIRQPNTRRRELLASFERALPLIIEALDRGDALIEIV